MGYLGATLTQVFAHVGGANMSLRDVTIAQTGNGLESAGDVTHRKRAEDFVDFEKVSWVEFCLGRRRLAFVCSPKPGQWGGWGADGKVIIERLCISLSYVETFNSKVIKGFVPELRSRKCFSCFEIPIFYVYMLWTFYVRFPYSCMGMLHW